MFKQIFKKNNGFTLVEMLIVLLVISVLIILIVPNLSNSSSDINKKGCEALTIVVQSQVDLYYLENKKLPGSLAELVTAGYITEDQTKCSNGQALIYDTSSGQVTKQSAT